MGSLMGSAVKKQCDEHGPFDAVESTRFGRQFVTTCPKCALTQIHGTHQHEVAQRQLVLAPKGLPPRYQGLSFQELHLEDEAQKVLAQKLNTYVRHFKDSVKRCSFIVFTGNYNSTPMAAAMLSAAGAKGLRTRYTTAQDYILEVRSSYATGSKLTEEQVLTKYATDEVLVIDEMAATRNTQDDRLLLSTLLEKRYSNLLATVLLINGDRYALDSRVSDSTFELIVENGKILNCLPESSQSNSQSNS